MQQKFKSSFYFRSHIRQISLLFVNRLQEVQEKTVSRPETFGVYRRTNTANIRDGLRRLIIIASANFNFRGDDVMQRLRDRLTTAVERTFCAATLVIRLFCVILTLSMEMETSLMKALENLHLAEKSAVQISKPEADYVLDLAVQNGSDDPLLAAACSNFTIHLMSRNRLTHISTISGHNGTITKVQFGKTDLNLVYSSSKDKTVRCWDTRVSNSKEILLFKAPPAVQAEMLSLDISHSDKLLCASTEQAGSDSYLLFWDTRQNSLLGCYSECHQDDITQLQETNLYLWNPPWVAGNARDLFLDQLAGGCSKQVCFQPGSDRYLASGSADGLVCTFDLTETAEDDALQITSNAESDVARVGWCGSNSGCVYCVTSDNVFHVWDALEGDSCCTIDCFSGANEGATVDYVVDCIPELTASNDRSSAVLLVGTHSGNLQLLRCSDLSTDTQTLASLNGGHTATVRSSSWDTKTQLLLTGGEDSLLCLWSTDPLAQFSTKSNKTESPAKMKVKASISEHTKKPYSKMQKS